MALFEQKDLPLQPTLRLFVAHFFQSIAFDVDVQFEEIVSHVTHFLWLFLQQTFSLYTN